MKKIILFYFISTIALTTFGQNGVGIGTESPHSSAVLDISSTTKGLLIPRMTGTQRTAIVSPAAGLLVYDTEAKSLYQYNGTIWVSIGGSAGNQLDLPFAASDAGAVSFQVNNTFAGGKAIVGKANANSINSIAISGEAAVGIAIKGYSNDAGSIAVFGSSLSGTAVSAYSFAGTALDVNGKVKIAGGNTNPSNGAILTSDASGNATWKPQRVAFSAISTVPSPVIPEGLSTTLSFQTEEFDLGSNFNPSSAATDKNTFIAPVNGVYHFSGRVYLGISSASTNLAQATLSILKNGTIKYVAWSGGPANSSIDSDLGISIDQTMQLIAGDKIKLGVNQTNLTSLSANYSWGSFSGHLVFAD